ncbi:hypothetical protein IFM89_007138 [Coptis chinensis]|uniref:F-box domain-containing protein n=1 Tax=Coptis chinensis TaxID=261450 RepID=A0A835HBN2_9MAGN|nr:hypothetical protein IFM89_007138 [Coptis chinensis]
MGNGVPAITRNKAPKRQRRNQLVRKAQAIKRNSAPEPRCRTRDDQDQEAQRRNRDEQRTGTRDWARLPEGLVDAISNRLPVVSAISKGFVCESWRRMVVEQVPPTHKRGLLRLMLCGENNSVNRTCLSVLENRIMELNIPEALGRSCGGSIQDWLIVVKKAWYRLYIFGFQDFKFGAKRLSSYVVDQSFLTTLSSAMDVSIL